MKSLLASLFVVLVSYIVYSQTLLCYSGAIVNGKGAENITVRNCTDHGVRYACQTKFEVRDPLANQENYTSVVRECVQSASCFIQQNSNAFKCDPGENLVRVCFECCLSDLCNDNTELAPLPEVKK